MVGATPADGVPGRATVRPGTALPIAGFRGGAWCALEGRRSFVGPGSPLLTSMPRTLLMSPARVRRTLTRLAYEVVERNRGGEGLEVFGIRRRGLALAELMAEVLEGVERRAFPVRPLDVEAFRDDRTDAPPVPLPAPDAPSVTGRDVLLVDDVLFTGRTARAAIDAALGYGRPRSLQLAVLIDRGHREFPIQPDYVGLVIPTKHRERVVVEVDGAPAVYLEE